MRVSAFHRNRCPPSTVFRNAVFIRERNRPVERKSQDEIVRALDRLFLIIKKQRRMAPDDPRCAGYQWLMVHSGGQGPDHPGWHRDQLGSSPGGYPTLDGKQGWLETVLRDLRNDLAAVSLRDKRRGRPKSQPELWVIESFAGCVRSRCGGWRQTAMPIHTHRTAADMIELMPEHF